MNDDGNQSPRLESKQNASRLKLHQEQGEDIEFMALLS